jgi:hypothetical protein
MECQPGEVDQVIGNTLVVPYAQISKFMFSIASFVRRSKVGIKFIQERFPVIKPFWRLIGKSGNSRFKPFLSDILKVG